MKWLIVAHFQISRAEPLTKIILEKLIQPIHKSVLGESDVNRHYPYFLSGKAVANTNMIQAIHVGDYDIKQIN